MKMRRWCVILMLFLLPFRAWAGGAMVTVMPGANGPQDMTSSAAQAGAAPVACHGAMVADQSGHHAHDEHTGESSPTSHQLCDICNVPALGVPVLELSLTGSLHSRACVPSVPFVSVWPSRDSRPPIA